MMDTKIRCGFVFVTLFLIVSSTVFANDLSVGQGENYVTIQTAINAVNPGDSVIPDFPNKSLQKDKILIV